jgi:polysaccharide export outer membrane protein
MQTAPPVPAATTGGQPGTLKTLPPMADAQQDPKALERLQALRDARLKSGPGTDTPVGPGDVIEVSVPQVKELAFVTTRVAGDGTISLPLLGTFRAGGHSEEAVRQEIRTRLGSIMYDPQVTVFVREYKSRKVSVIGSVPQPGLYEPATPTDTIFDMLAQARGPSPDAARTVVFIPNTGRTGDATATAKDLEALLRNVDPIVFNLRDMDAAMSEVVMSLPVRPGDVIMIPEAGSVFIQGWVEKPGYYKISHDLSMLSVVAAAGGAMFPADMAAARLIRSEPSGERKIFDVDLQAVARGEKPDVFVQNGDVIEIGATPPKLVAYGLFYFFTAVFHVGAGLSVI